jgi:hypothetical protein
MNERMNFEGVRLNRKEAYLSLVVVLGHEDSDFGLRGLLGSGGRYPGRSIVGGPLVLTRGKPKRAVIGSMGGT